MKIVLDIFSLFKKHSEIPLTSNDDEAYSLRLFDDELLYFTMCRSGLEGLKTRILRLTLLLVILKLYLGIGNTLFQVKLLITITKFMVHFSHSK